MIRSGRSGSSKRFCPVGLMVDIGRATEYHPVMMGNMDNNSAHNRATSAGWFYFYFTPPALLVGRSELCP